MKTSYFLAVILGLVMTAGVVFADDVIMWTFQTGKAIYTNPVHHEGILYIGSLDGIFYAVHAETGEQLWQYETDNPIHSNAAVFDNGICFESGNILYALDFQGNLLWNRPLYTESVTNQIDTWDFVHSSPNIVNGIVYIGTEKGWIDGFNVQTGEETFKVQAPNQGTIRVMPVIDNNRLYVGDWEGVLYCYDTQTGEILWQYDTTKDASYEWTNAILTPLLVQDNVVYFAGRGCMAYALDALTGEKLWMYNQASVWVVGGTVISDDMIYFGSSNQSLLYALDISTGESIWNLGVDYRLWNSPLVSGEVLFFGCRSFYAVNRKTGEVVNRMFFDPEDVHTEPVHIWYWAADYYGNADAISNFHSSAIEVDDKIIVGCDDGNLYAFNRDNFISMPLSRTSMDGGDMLLGDLPIDTNHQIEVPVTNTGNKTDSITISISGASLLKRAVTLEQNQTAVPAGETAIIRLDLNPSGLKTKSYTLTVIVDSRYNVQENHITKVIRFTMVDPTDVGMKSIREPVSFALEPNVPNPFNPVTLIAYCLTEPSKVILKICDITGKEKIRIVDAFQSAGRHTVFFDGSTLTSGTYIGILKAGKNVAARKMVLIK